MKMIRRSGLSGMAMAAMMLAPCAALAQSNDTETEKTDDKLEEITVTAQRTGQRLQDVPVAVTALSADRIETLQIVSPTDLDRMAPNVKFDGVTGGTAGLKPFIRGGGVTDGAFVTSESEVAMYVDDVYRARLAGSLLEFVELERIEVLRGPQGVLYGRNSSAGAVNIITKAPSDHLQGAVTAGFGSWNERRLKAYLSTPLTADGKWRASINGLIRGRDGGRQTNITTGKKVGAEDFSAVQGDLAYVGDGLEGRLTGYYMHGTSDGQYAVATRIDANGDIVPVTGSYRRVQSPVPSFTRLEQYGGTLRLSADMGENGKLTSITAYSAMNDAWRQDFSGGVSPAALGLPGTTPLALFDRTASSDQHQFSQEMQATGSVADNLIEYVAGAYFFTETANQRVNSTIFFVPSQTTFSIQTNSFAGYGQVTLNATDALALVAAGRYTIDDKRLDAVIGGQPVAVANTYERFTPKLGINYKINSDVLAYVSYSQGFKAGGYNGFASNASQLAQPFEPQVTSAYEVGLKSDLFDRRARLNIAAFYNKIQNRQQTLNTNNGGFLIENYDAWIKGIEAEFSWRVMSGLTLWGNGSVNEGSYDSSAVGGSLEGNELPVLPPHQFNLGFDSDLPVGPGTLRFGADYSNRAPYFSTPDNSAIGRVDRLELIGAYVGYEVGPWRFQVTGKNLADREGSQTGFGFAVVQPRFAINPRMVLGTVRYEF